MQRGRTPRCWPRDIATACCVCHTKVGPGNPNRVCADATCPAAAAGDETVDTYVFADVLSVRAGDLFDGIYAAIPMPIAQELFHALPPYPNADVMKQQSVECCVTLHRGTVAATALVNHDVA
ncbi:hypothetical protein HXX76_016319 [Chlamydomonas incerta]|uniref:Uncharacterized protein n=1 Tax=Chlamydomonas incerta TaxID=51695 RepID=A0A835VQR7_CHLIN|nr:hypothetical protein HXX76_016319 [Chlamydomonas incerta]|eukprot:KAG2422036.1 hypothetical protein HXX76_016319 [Chlamydomonas incerta]